MTTQIVDVLLYTYFTTPEGIFFYIYISEAICILVTD
jgi:hypothetical protein